MKETCLIIAFICALLAGISARASELPEFYRGVRAMGMGNAFTAVSDDADAVFYNPAGLGLNSHYDFRLINPKVDTSTDDLLLVGDIKSAVKKLDSSAVNALYGKHLYGDISVFPSILFPNFIIGYYADANTQVISRNLALPSIDASYTKDTGVVSGFGYEMRGLSRRHFLRMGVAVKWLRRQGFHAVIPLTTLAVADKSTLAKLSGGPATGWGGSFGLQYEIPINTANDIILGSSWQDIGDTSFGNSLQTNPPPAIRNNLATGLAFVHRFSGSMHSRSNFKLSAEMRNLIENNIDPRLRAHFGFELLLGDVSLQGGLNQDSLTGGIKLDMLFLEISAVTYGVETQSLAMMDRERRYMVQFTMKFDIMGKQVRSDREVDRRKHPRNY